MSKLGKFVFALSALCAFAIGAEAQYTITLTSSATSIYIPSINTITWNAMISPPAPMGNSVDVVLQDTTHGNIQGSITVDAGNSVGNPISVPAYGTLSANTMDEVTGVAVCTGCTTEMSNKITINLLVNAPTLSFVTRTIDVGGSTPVKASIPAPTDFAIVINELFSGTGSLSIGDLEIAQGATTSNSATATGVSSGSVTVTPYYQYYEDTGTASGQPVGITVEP